MPGLKAALLGILISATLHGNEILIHEGLLTPIREVEPSLAISKAPPREIQEKIPAQPGGEFVWLSGYWFWDGDQSDYVWVNGFWRRPPPDKAWTQGKWQQWQDNWVWLKGFWSDQPLETMTFIANEPPDLIEEEIEKPLNENYFWVPGHYTYNNKGYKWEKGYWELFDHQWVLVPSRFEWRPEGFFHLASYWDWPLEKRGEIYSSLDPLRTISTLEIVNKLFYSYPDYLVFFAHYNHYHPKSISDAPPWWSWQTWWTYSWPNQWALWWWYTHPGYIQPKWMTLEISNHIIPPSLSLEEAMKKVTPPLIVTDNGVISSKKAAKATRKLVNRFLLPLNKVSEFHKMVLPRLKSSFKALLPNGKTNAMLLSRPQFVQKSEDKKSSRSPIKPYLKKLKSKLSNLQDIAMDNSTTQTQQYWEEEIRDRDKRRSQAEEARKAEFNANSADTVQYWNESVQERNRERESYAEETYRHQQEAIRAQQFWQPQINAREQEYKEEEKAIQEREQQHYQMEQEYLNEQKARERLMREEDEEPLSYSSYDARRDAMRNDTRRYWQNRDSARRDIMRYQQNQENIKRSNLRYQQQQEDLKRDTLRYQQHQEDLQKERLKQEEQNREKQQEDEKFWEEYRKLQIERGDVEPSVSEDEKWWLKKDDLRREEILEEEKKFWEDQEREKEEAIRRAREVQFDTPKLGVPLPPSKN